MLKANLLALAAGLALLFVGGMEAYAFMSPQACNTTIPAPVPLPDPAREYACSASLTASDVRNDVIDDMKALVNGIYPCPGCPGLGIGCASTVSFTGSLTISIGILDCEPCPPNQCQWSAFVTYIGFSAYQTCGLCTYPL